MFGVACVAFCKFISTAISCLKLLHSTVDLFTVCPFKSGLGDVLVGHRQSVPHMSKIHLNINNCRHTLRTFTIYPLEVNFTFPALVPRGE